MGLLPRLARTSPLISTWATQKTMCRRTLSSWGAAGACSTNNQIGVRALTDSHAVTQKDNLSGEIQTST